MAWVSLLAVIILIFSFLGGMKQGAVKQFFSLAVFIVAIPLAGFSYRLIAIILSFLPGENWENFIGFFIDLALVSVILHFIIFLPRKISQTIWRKGIIFRLVGGVLNFLQAGMGLVVFTLIIVAYPIFSWLEKVVVGSSVLAWLVEQLGFIQTLLPELFQQAATMVSLI